MMLKYYFDHLETEPCGAYAVDGRHAKTNCVYFTAFGLTIERTHVNLKYMRPFDRFVFKLSQNSEHDSSLLLRL
jgi:hypothetical protein